jgi:hypothetical protein
LPATFQPSTVTLELHHATGVTRELIKFSVDRVRMWSEFLAIECCCGYY